ncbi:MAG: hypothetical protein F6K21_19485 [Symploca sp. SIO2D2]|nr:hypothetical protein [Symploca sp. SIO2D2]
MKIVLRICLGIVALFCLTFANPSYALASCTGSSVTPSPQYGGNGGDPFTDIAKSTQEVSSIRIRSGEEIDLIQICFRDQEGKIDCKGEHGGNGGSPSTFNLAPGEFINKIEIRSGARIDQLKFFTNTGNVSPTYGGTGGSPHIISDICLNGIAGRSGARLDAFQAFNGL